jgi:hypothetical protein
MNILNKTGWFFIATLLFTITLSSQSILSSIDSVYAFHTEEASIIKVSSKKNDAKIFFLSYENLENIPIFEINETEVIIDSIPNVKIEYSKGEYYYPYIRSMYYEKDMFYMFYGYGIVKALKKGNEWSIENIYEPKMEQVLEKYDRILGRYEDNVLLANDMYYKNRPANNTNYTIGMYDISKKKLVKEITIDCNKGILLNLFSFINLFSINDENISFLNPIKPEIYLFDQDLNILDTITFCEINGLSYLNTVGKLDGLFTEEFLCKSIDSPKNIIFLLYREIITDKENCYGINIKQQFIDENKLLVEYIEIGKKTALIFFVIDIKERKINNKIIFDDLEILNSDLIWSENLPLFNDGLFINVNKKLTSDEESIKFGFDIYSIDAFKQFRTK